MKKRSFKIIFICGLILLVGTSLSLGLFYSIESSNEFKREKTLSDTYKIIHNAIEQEIARNLNALHALRANHLAHGGINRVQFSKYASYYTKNIKSIQALEWVPEITHDERDSFEIATRLEGFPDFEIITKQGDGLARAEPRDVYHPVYFIEPFAGNELALGYDPGQAVPAREHAINKAIATRKAAASDGFPIIQKEYPHKAIAVFVPIFTTDGNRLLGLIEGVYLMDKLVETALSNINVPASVEVTIFNQGNWETTLFGQPTTAELTHKNTRDGELLIADRSWNLQMYDADASEISGIKPTWILLGSLLLTLLVVKVAYDAFTNNRKELERHVVQLEKKNQDLEQYAYVASHDLQEPLHSIQSLVTIFGQEYKNKIDEQGQQYLVFIVEASLRMSSLIRNLLHHSRIGHMEKREQVDVNILLKEVEQDLSALIKNSGASITKNGTLPTLEGFRNALYQLFQNLIMNAIKFQEGDHKPIIDISSEKKDDHWQFMITDNGIGIPKEAQKEIFVIFKRLHNSSEYAGTGIGLANCKKIVELHNGKIWIESQPGIGSTFYFTLNL